EPFLISASVLLIIAQRLIRVLCPNCKTSFEPTAAVVDKIKAIMGDHYEAAKFYKAKGCDRCHETGYKGRRGIYEILSVTSAIRELTINHGSLDEIRALARQQGMRTLLEEGARAVMEGVTTVEEMMRVCAMDQ